MIGFLVAGAPGVGKTALLEALGAQGFRIMGDAARGLIRERKGRGLPPRPAPAEFAAEILRRDAAQYEAASRHPEIVFFERGVPDSLGLLSTVRELADGELEAQLVRHAYHRTAFVLPPWESIFVQDDERDQTFADALRIHASVAAWYARCGFRVVGVPLATVAERCAFVIGEVTAACGLGPRPRAASLEPPPHPGAPP